MPSLPPTSVKYVHATVRMKHTTIYYYIYINVYEIYFPLKKITVSRRDIKRKPWVTKGLLKSSLSKSKLLRMKLTNPCERTTRRHTDYCNLFNKLKMIAKKNYCTMFLTQKRP